MLRGNEIKDCAISSNGARFRVDNLPFLKPDFEILTFFEHLWLFYSIKKTNEIWLFSVGKVWLWKKHCLSCIFITNLFCNKSVAMQGNEGAQNIEIFYCCPKNDRCY